MQSTNTPAKFVSPIAQQDGSRAEVPLTTSDATRASQSAGFPPLTGQPPEAGGVPPQLPDMNGLLNMISRGPWWTFAGGRYVFDAAYATNAAINGYPRGAVLASADLTGEWFSTAENNVVTPATVGTGWVPGTFYGQTLLAKQTGGTVTLTPAQAAKPVLRITGTLVGNLIVELPAWIREWTVYNSTSGAFSVSVRTPGRPSVVVPQTGAPIAVRGDGTDVSVVTLTVPAASTTVAGITRLATAAEAVAGSSQAIAVTPFGLTQAAATLVPAASTTVAGRIRIATPAEANGTSTALAVAPAQLTADRTAVRPVSAGGTGASSWPAAQFLMGASGGSGGIVAVAGSEVRTRIGAPQLAGPNTFTGTQTINGAVVSSDTVVSGGVFRSNGSEAIFGTTTPGVINFRANGNTSESGQMTLSASGALRVNGAVTATGGFQGSSRTVKDHIHAVPSSEALALVESIEAVTYRYKPEYRDDGDRRSFGFIAEELLELLPEVVRESDGKSPYVVEHAQLTSVLWAAVQHLAARVRELEDR